MNNFINLSWIVIGWMFVVGTIIGSFLNCVIWRSYSNESALKGRSYCPKCKHKLEWVDLIPLLSFLMLKGKCRYCGKKISVQYPLVELATAFLFVFTGMKFAPEMMAGYFSLPTIAILAAYWVIISSIVVIFVADLRWYFIPDGAVISGLLGALLLRAAQVWQGHIFLNSANWDILINSGSSAFFAVMFFLGIFIISHGAWMGFGDVKYAAMMGLVLGFPAILIGLFIAFFTGSLLGILLVIAGRKKMSSEVPFGPFLTAGTIGALFFTNEILDWYMTIGY